MADAPSVELTGIRIRTKIPKTTKNNKPFWILESNQGSFMCFDASAAGKVQPSETAVYTVMATPPTGDFKSYVLKKVVDVKEGTAAPASAPAQAPASATARSYTGTGMSGDLAKDTRISKLSVFNAIAAIQAAKIRAGDPNYTGASTAAYIAENIELTNAVMKELIYPDRAKVADLPTAEKHADGSTYSAPAAQQPTPAGQPAAAGLPPTSPKPEPQQPAASQQPAADKDAQAKQLFGVKSSLDAAMADRVNHMLNK